MDSMQNVSDAGLYTDFGGLARLRAKAAGQSGMVADAATKEVAKQFESLFLQMMLKSMRDAIPSGESVESDQTKFYQEMFDKQIALDLSSNGDGIGLAKMLEKQISGKPNVQASGFTEVTDLALIRKQIERQSSIYDVSPEGVGHMGEMNNEQHSGQE